MLPETERIFPNAAFDFCEVHATLLIVVCYSHGNRVRNGAQTHYPPKNPSLPDTLPSKLHTPTSLPKPCIYIRVAKVVTVHDDLPTQ